MFPCPPACCSYLKNNAALTTIVPGAFNGLTVGTLCVCFAASGRCDGYMRDLYLRRSLAGQAPRARDHRSNRGAVVLLQGALLLGSLSGADLGVQRAALLRCGLLSWRI